MTAAKCPLKLASRCNLSLEQLILTSPNLGLVRVEMDSHMSEIETMIARTHCSSDQIVAERGEQIYKERFQAAHEKEYIGQYIAIDIMTKKAYVAPSSEDAVNAAHTESPDGLFHVMRIGTSRPAVTTQVGLDRSTSPDSISVV